MGVMPQRVARSRRGPNRRWKCELAWGSASPTFRPMCTQLEVIGGWGSTAWNTVSPRALFFAATRSLELGWPSSSFDQVQF